MANDQDLESLKLNLLENRRSRVGEYSEGMVDVDAAVKLPLQLPNSAFAARPPIRSDNSGIRESSDSSWINELLQGEPSQEYTVANANSDVVIPFMDEVEEQIQPTSELTVDGGQDASYVTKYTSYQLAPVPEDDSQDGTRVDFTRSGVSDGVFADLNDSSMENDRKLDELEYGELHDLQQRVPNLIESFDPSRIQNITTARNTENDVRWRPSDNQQLLAANEDTRDFSKFDAERRSGDTFRTRTGKVVRRKTRDEKGVIRSEQMDGYRGNDKLENLVAYIEGAEAEKKMRDEQAGKKPRKKSTGYNEHSVNIQKNEKSTDANSQPVVDITSDMPEKEKIPNSRTASDAEASRKDESQKRINIEGYKRCNMMETSADALAQKSPALSNDLSSAKPKIGGDIVSNRKQVSGKPDICKLPAGAQTTSLLSRCVSGTDSVATVRPTLSSSSHSAIAAVGIPAAGPVQIKPSSNPKVASGHPSDIAASQLANGSVLNSSGNNTSKLSYALVASTTSSNRAPIQSNSKREPEKLKQQTTGTEPQKRVNVSETPSGKNNAESTSGKSELRCDKDPRKDVDSLEQSDAGGSAGQPQSAELNYVTPSSTTTCAIPPTAIPATVAALFTQSQTAYSQVVSPALVVSRCEAVEQKHEDDSGNDKNPVLQMIFASCRSSDSSKSSTRKASSSRTPDPEDVAAEPVLQFVGMAAAQIGDTCKLSFVFGDDDDTVINNLMNRSLAADDVANVESAITTLASRNSAPVLSHSAEETCPAESACKRGGNWDKVVREMEAFADKAWTEFTSGSSVPMYVPEKHN